MPATHTTRKESKIAAAYLPQLLLLLLLMLLQLPVGRVIIFGAAFRVFRVQIKCRFLVTQLAAVAVVPLLPLPPSATALNPLGECENNMSRGRRMPHAAGNGTSSTVGQVWRVAAHRKLNE